MFKHILLATLMAGSALAHASSATPSPQHDKPGFTTYIEDGRLWVFKEGSKELEEFKQHGEPIKQFTRIGEGPEGMTVKAADPEHLSGYLGN